MKRFDLGQWKRLWPKRFRNQLDPGAPGGSDDEVLAILEDLDNGNEFYVSIVDSFQFAGREYVAMSSFEPRSRSTNDPEFIFMRFDTGPDGEHMYQSIRNERELDAVFNVFFERYIGRVR